MCRSLTHPNLVATRSAFCFVISELKEITFKAYLTFLKVEHKTVFHYSFQQVKRLRPSIPKMFEYLTSLLNEGQRGLLKIQQVP